MTAEKKSKSLKRLVLMILAEFLLVALAVWIIDPFYQYHGPILGDRAVLNDRDNQMAGSIRNFRYDSVLVGSSVAENFDTDYLNSVYGGQTLKVIRASGSVADLNYYLEMAQKERELNNIFWCLDLFAMTASTEVTLYGGDTPRYLHTDSILDDLPYLYNKEILLEKIPAMLAFSYQGTNIGGQAYNWSKGKEFSAVMAMRAYDRNAVSPEGQIANGDEAADRELVARNIAILTEQIESHPDIQYRFLIPPYSMLWWDCAYVNGELEERFLSLEMTLPALLVYDNVEIYFFQDEDWIVCNLDYYMDMIHYSPEINQYMLEQMAAGENKVTLENWGESLSKLREMTERIINEEIYRYYPSALPVLLSREISVE